MLKHEIKESLLLGVEVRVDIDLRLGRADLTRERDLRIRDMGKQVEKIAVLGIDDLLHFGKLFSSEPRRSESLQ